MGYGVIKHPLITIESLCADKVHLSASGNALFLAELEEAAKIIFCLNDEVLFRKRK